MSIIKIHNVATDEIIEREMTDEELTKLELLQAEANSESEAKAEAQLKKDALLAKLGITEEEAKLLLS